MSSVAIIIPMYNEEGQILRTLKAVRAACQQWQGSSEVLVIDNGSSDNGPQLAESLGVRVIDGRGLTIGAMRNLGASLTESDYLAFIDADIEMPAQWLSQCEATHNEDGSALIALAMKAPAHAPWYAQVWQARQHGFHRPKQRLNWIPSTNLWLTREAFQRSGGFSSRLRTGEDKAFGLHLHALGYQQQRLSSPVAVNYGYERSFSEWCGKELWRQNNHFRLCQEQQLGFRALRFPLLAFAVALISLLSLGSYLLWAIQMNQPNPFGWAALLLALASLSAGGILAARQCLKVRRPGLLLPLWLLHWVRLHLAAWALALNVLNQHSRRPSRG
ncbi:glycosyltransferase [Pokkaliibacter sp. CJK22405]|uniref:glycosyltransferase n=1 Tax=Pokkaliibacter sp. CJK22405 TaxID=3384615 RepID=UPI00398537FD